MQLYSIPFSPYASRCRIQIYHKSLPVEVIAPPGGLRSPEVLAGNPGGRIPVLTTAQGALAESWAIMEFLEDLHPEIPMRPDSDFGRARQRELVRFADLYLASALFPLFRALRGAAVNIEESLGALKEQLAVLEAQWPRRPAAADLDLLDAAVLPIVWYTRLLAAHNGETDVLSDLPRTRDWWQAGHKRPAAARVLGEMEDGLKAAIPTLFPE